MLLLLIFIYLNVSSSIESLNTGLSIPDELKSIWRSFSMYDTNQKNYTSNSDISIHPAWKYIDDDKMECGESYSDRIIGGVDAALGQYPWIALLGFVQWNEILFLCGGTLINPWYVLTAAHCTVTEEVTLKLVRLGEYDLREKMDCLQNVCAAPVQDIPISDIIRHDNFNTPPYSNDIALLRLSRRAIYNGWVSPICLPHEPIDTSTGVAEVCGWGITSMETMQQATVLQTLKIPLLQTRICQRLYERIEIRSQQICAGGQENKDSCGGDSGGPLMKVDASTGTPKYNLIGIVSFGPSRCGSKAPGVYVKISYFLQWILDNIKP